MRVGTRGSALARWQADHVAKLLAHTGAAVELVVISTRGDRVLDAPLPKIGGKGVFTEEIEAALLDGRIDVAVHSLKDLPTEMSPGLVLGAIPERADPRDALIVREKSAESAGLAGLRAGAVVGTSSLRRIAQVLRVRPDLVCRDIRGNVDTRVRKCVELGEYDAILLACAGLDRLGMGGVISHRFEAAEMMPAPGQAALGIQCVAGSAVLGRLAGLHDVGTALAVTAERAALARLGGGCSLPVGALGALASGVLSLRVRVSSVDGKRQLDREISGAAATVAEAEHLGRTIAERLLGDGAASVLSPG